MPVRMGSNPDQMPLVQTKSAGTTSLNKEHFNEFLGDPKGFLDKGNTRMRVFNVAGADSLTINSARIGKSELLVCDPSSALKPVKLEIGKDPAGKDELTLSKADASPDVDQTSHKAYFLPWGADKAYSIKLSNDADFFVTAQLNGCGICVSDESDGLRVVHQNLMDKAKEETQSYKDRLYSRLGWDSGYLQRNQQYLLEQRGDSLNTLLHDLKESGDVHGSATLSEKDYDSAAKASVFGVRQDGLWHIYVNSKDKETGNFTTKELYAQKPRMSQ